MFGKSRVTLQKEPNMPGQRITLATAALLCLTFFSGRAQAQGRSGVFRGQANRGQHVRRFHCS